MSAEDQKRKNRLISSMLHAKPFLNSKRLLTVIPKMDLDYNLEKLAQWRAKQEQRNG